MRFVVLDFESYFADDYTLSKMTTESYIRSPRFQAHGAAIKWSKDHAAKWYDEPALRYVLSQENWSDVFLIHHHAQFDGLILSHQYGVVPAMYGCTLSMARLLLGNHISVSLDSVRAQFGLPAKRTPYNLFRGKRWGELDQSTRDLVAEGACDEVESIFKIFGLLAKDFPKEEYLVVDQTIRMFTQPVLRADTDLLAQIWSKEDHDKRVRLAALDISASDLASSDKFADLLRDAGVEPETKEGPPRKSGARGTIYAFAKKDPFMEELLEHEDDRVKALAEARLGEKSNILQTRAETLGWMASRGPLCVYLRMYGAHTTRWSGGNSSNFQNFKKPDLEYPKQAKLNLRDAILPPEGYILAKPDLSQIECRLLNFVAGQDDVIERFRNGQDPYVNVASAFYGYPVNKKDHPKERQVGKILELQCLGPDTLVLTKVGTKPITKVLLTDQLWDGVEWVSHRGLVANGERYVIKVAGLCLTPDHPVLCGSTWKAASNLHDENTLFQALERGSANLPSQVIRSPRGGDYKELSCSAHAALQNILYLIITYEKALVRGVINVLKKPLATGKRNFTVTPMYVQMMGTEYACYSAYERSEPDARTATETMVDGVLLSPLNGVETTKSFLNTYSRSQAGIILNYIWTALTIIWGIGLETFGLSRRKRTIRTVERSPSWRGLLPTYDLACAGPRNRFTAVSSAGFFIVHNCGYGSGGLKIAATLRSKAGIILTPEEAIKARDAYRDTHPAVVDLWRIGGRMLSRLAGGPPTSWGPTTVREGRIYLPNGCPLNYQSLEFYRDEEDGEEYWRLKARNNRWVKMYGAKLVENLIQALARVVISQAFIRLVGLGYRIVGMEHDSLWILIPKDGKEQWHIDRCLVEMSRTPAWLPGIPLAAECS